MPTNRWWWLLYSSVQQFTPIVLLVVAEQVDVGFNPLIVVLHLPLHLWVVGCGELLIDVRGFEEATCVIAVNVVLLSDL
jgi:hypothetical protein